MFAVVLIPEIKMLLLIYSGIQDIMLLIAKFAL